MPAGTAYALIGLALAGDGAGPGRAARLHGAADHALALPGRDGRAAGSRAARSRPRAPPRRHGRRCVRGRECRRAGDECRGDSGPGARRPDLMLRRPARRRCAAGAVPRHPGRPRCAGRLCAWPARRGGGIVAVRMASWVGETQPEIHPVPGRGGDRRELAAADERRVGAAALDRHVVTQVTDRGRDRIVDRAQRRLRAAVLALDVLRDGRPDPARGPGRRVGDGPLAVLRDAVDGPAATCAPAFWSSAGRCRRPGPARPTRPAAGRCARPATRSPRSACHRASLPCRQGNGGRATAASRPPAA